MTISFRGARYTAHTEPQLLALLRWLASNQEAA